MISSTCDILSARLTFCNVAARDRERQGSKRQRHVSSRIWPLATGNPERFGGTERLSGGQRQGGKHGNAYSCSFVARAANVITTCGRMPGSTRRPHEQQCSHVTTPLMAKSKMWKLRNPPRAARSAYISFSG